jgi:hypothetical protein
MTSSANIIAGSGTSFSIHGAGWFLIFLICFSIFIGYKIAKRQQKNAKEKNLFAVGYISLIIFCCSLFGTFFPYGLLKQSSLFITGTRYEATVTNVHERTETTGEDGRSRTQTMYTPEVTFTTHSGKIIVRDGSLSSSDPDKIGDVITLYYNEKTDSLIEYSIASVAMLIGGLIFSGIFTLIMIGAILYAFNKNTQPIITIMIVGGQYFVLPLIILLFTLGLWSYPIRRIFFDYQTEQPLWVIPATIFFALTMSAVCVGYVKMVFLGEKKK